jgi:hypothetical protein
VAVAAHGQVKVLGEALAAVPLRADQRAEIEQLASDAETRHGAAKSARAALMTALADQMQRGSIDRVALQPRIDAAAAAFTQSRPADRAGMERLHALLDASQRGAFVDALEAKFEAQHESRTQERQAGHGMLKEWATDLSLSDAQQAQIKDQLHAMHAMKEGAEGHHGAWKQGVHHGKQVMEAFRGERFVLDEIAPQADPQPKAGAMADRMISLAEVVLPILTPEQRSLAAAKLRARAEQMAADMDPEGP